MRWWRLAAGGAVLLWVLGTAYRQARKRGRDIGAAVVMVGVSVFMFAVAALAPRPPMSAEWASILVIGSILLLGIAMVIVLWKGFRE